MVKKKKFKTLGTERFQNIHKKYYYYYYYYYYCCYYYYYYSKVQEVTAVIREKGINDMECIDMEEWKRKRKLKH